MAEVSIIIPYYNKKATIARAVESVINQTYNNWEVIIVDDFSDEPLVLMPGWQNFPITIFRNSTNLGPGPTRQFGMDSAKGNFLAFLDADDWWGNLFLEKSMFVHTTHPEIAATWVRSEIILEDGSRIYRKYSEVPFTIIRETLIKYPRPWQTGSLLWKRKFCGSWGYLSTSQDYWFEFSSSRLSNKVQHIPEILYFVDRTAGFRRMDYVSEFQANINLLNLFLEVYSQFSASLSLKYRLSLTVRIIRYIKFIKHLPTREQKDVIWANVEKTLPWTVFLMRSDVMFRVLYQIAMRTSLKTMY